MLIGLFLGALLTSMQATAAAPIGPGVSESLAAERRAHDHRFEVMAVAPHFDVLAREAALDPGLDLLGV